MLNRRRIQFSLYILRDTLHFFISCGSIFFLVVGCSKKKTFGTKEIYTEAQSKKEKLNSGANIFVVHYCYYYATTTGMRYAIHQCSPVVISFRACELCECSFFCPFLRSTMNSKTYNRRQYSLATYTSHFFTIAFSNKKTCGRRMGAIVAIIEF